MSLPTSVFKRRTRSSLDQAYPPYFEAAGRVTASLPPYFEAVGRVTASLPPYFEAAGRVTQAYPPILRPQAGLHKLTPLF